MMREKNDQVLPTWVTWGVSPWCQPHLLLWSSCECTHWNHLCPPPTERGDRPVL